MGPVRIRHHSSHDFGRQSSHSVDLAGWQAKMASIEIWIPWLNAHKPHWLGDSTLHIMSAWCWQINFTCLHMILTLEKSSTFTFRRAANQHERTRICVASVFFFVAKCLPNSNSLLLYLSIKPLVVCCAEKLSFSTIRHAPARLQMGQLGCLPEEGTSLQVKASRN